MVHQALLVFHGKLDDQAQQAGPLVVVQDGEGAPLAGLKGGVAEGERLERLGQRAAGPAQLRERPGLSRG